MAEAQLGASIRPSTEDSTGDETRNILKSTQIMMGTLIQKLSNIENKMSSSKVEQKRLIVFVTMHEESMNTAPGRGQEGEINDSSSSVSDRGQEVRLQ